MYKPICTGQSAVLLLGVMTQAEGQRALPERTQSKLDGNLNRCLFNRSTLQRDALHEA